jgi:hypothetical protein
MNYKITEQDSQMDDVPKISSVGVDDKILQIIDRLKNTVNELPNTWGSKQRETYVFNKLLEKNFTENGNGFLGNKNFRDHIKKVYNSSNPLAFTTKFLVDYFPNVQTDKMYIIQEPFGSKASPDFLFITSKGMFGVEDKSSKNEKIAHNTGSPGGNKFFTYYDRKNKKVYLLSGERWGWDKDIEKDYLKFKEDVRQYAKLEFQKRFGQKLKNMDYYARPMLVDKNKVKDIADTADTDVINMLKKFI